MSVASAVLFVYVIYWRTPAPEPAAWSCPAEWHVLPGDTLWSISRTCWPNRDPREGVDAIQAANPGLHPGRLRVGQVLRLPVNVEVAGGGGKQ